MTGQPEGQGEEQKKREPPKPRSIIVRVFRALKRHENRRRRRNTEHQINERMMARWTRHVGLFTGALVVIGIGTAVIFWRQLNVMQGQLGVMEAQQRPWIDFTLQTKAPITFTAQGRVSAEISLMPKNIAAIPAFDVRVAAVFVPGNFRDGPALGTQYQDETCRAAENGIVFEMFAERMIEEFKVGNVLFPDKTVSEGLFQNTKLTFSFVENSNRFVLTKSPNSPEYFVAEFIGCIVYHIIPNESRWHRTRFGLEIGQLNGGFLAPITAGQILPENVKFSADLASALNAAD